MSVWFRRKGRRGRVHIMSATDLDDPGAMSMFDMAARESDEKFNTRISTYLGDEQAMRAYRKAASVPIAKIENATAFMSTNRSGLMSYPGAVSVQAGASSFIQRAICRAAQPVTAKDASIRNSLCSSIVISTIDWSVG